jgi:hypothetical protein
VHTVTRFASGGQGLAQIASETAHQSHGKPPCPSSPVAVELSVNGLAGAMAVVWTSPNEPLVPPPVPTRRLPLGQKAVTLFPPLGAESVGLDAVTSSSPGGGSAQIA